MPLKHYCAFQSNEGPVKMQILIQWIWVGPETPFLINSQVMLVKLPDMDQALSSKDLKSTLVIKQWPF